MNGSLLTLLQSNVDIPITIHTWSRGSIFVHRIFPDLEDFLLNLDKDSQDSPPYSW